jgi:hypothetical protein
LRRFAAVLVLPQDPASFLALAQKYAGAKLRKAG